MPTSNLGLKARLARFRRVIELSQILNSTLDLPALLDQIVIAAREVTGTEASSILLTDQKTGELYFEAATGTKSEEVKRVVVPPESVAGWVARENQVQVINDVSVDPRFSPLADQQSGFSTRALIAVPLKFKDRTIGVLEVVNRIEGHPFDKEDVEVLTALASHAAIAIENARLFQQSDLISEMVHELRTPLTSIVAYSELLMGPVKLEQSKAFAETILQEATRLTSMINDFLDLARLQSGRARLKHEPVDLIDLIEECTSTVSAQAHKKNVRLETHILHNLPEMTGDRLLLKRVLLNLLSNAVKYNRPDGSVRTNVQIIDGYLHIAVRDNGRGIPQQDLPHIFEKFYRVADSEGWATGTGLGLSIAKEIAEVHQGRIEVESEVNNGSTFTLILPFHREF
jgi:signal transduction histidine kinase